MLITDDNYQVTHAEQSAYAPMPITPEGIVETQAITASHEEQSILALIPVIDEAIIEPTTATLTPDLDATTAYDGALAPVVSAVESAISSKLQDIIEPTSLTCSDVANIDHNRLASSQTPSMADESGKSSLVTEDSHNGTELKTQDAHTIIVSSSARLSLSRS